MVWRQKRSWSLLVPCELVLVVQSVDGFAVLPVTGGYPSFHRESIPPEEDSWLIWFGIWVNTTLLTNRRQIRNLAIHRLRIPVPQDRNPFINRKSLRVNADNHSHITRSIHTPNIHRFICNGKTGSIWSIVGKGNGERTRHISLVEELHPIERSLPTRSPPSTSTTQKSW